MVDEATIQDVKNLDDLYQKTKNVELLQPLIEKYLQYYQFDKANDYLTILSNKQGWNLQIGMDAHLVIYALLHSSNVKIDDPASITPVFDLVDAYRTQWLLTLDDGYFYKGLQLIRNGDYSGALNILKQIKTDHYQSFVSWYVNALTTFAKAPYTPAYYQDGLVSLAMLKNGYFTFAKKLALKAVLTNNEYVLPYQILAYANFLTHNRDSAIQYFLKLADFDTVNVSLYKFLIWASYYRYGDYEQSVVYLSQVEEVALQTDEYRYLLLDYLHSDDSSNVIRIRQNILGQNDISASDFYTYFDSVLYMPFRTGKPLQYYFTNPQLATLYVNKCSTLFSGWDQSVCNYGKVGLQLAQQNLSWVHQ